MGSFLAWRWARVGGIAVTLGGIVLSCVAYSTAPTMLEERTLLPALAFGLPFLVLGILFLVTCQAAERGDAT